MELNALGYTDKWIKYGLLNKTILKTQFEKFQKGDDKNTEHYRYEAFLSWLREKESLTDQEIKNYLELALEDSDKSMAGSAAKELFTSPKIIGSQFDFIKKQLPKFGSWTNKLIKREELKRQNKGR